MPLLAFLFTLEAWNPICADDSLSEAGFLSTVTVSSDRFQAYGGMWSVESGMLRARSGPGNKLIVKDADISEGETGVEMLLETKKGGNAGMIVKVSRCGVGADRFTGYEVALDAENQFLRIARHRQNYEPIRDAPCTVPVGKWFSLVVTMTRKQVSVFVDGKPIISFDDTQHPLTTGSVGLRTWQRSARYRNLWIRQKGSKRIEVPFFGTPPEKLTELKKKLSLATLPRIALITRYPLSRPPAAGQDLWASKPRKPGCSIRIVDPASSNKVAETIFSDPEGCIYDLNISLDAKKLFFSYQRKGEHNWHIWRIDTDGSGLTQLTRGPYYDVSPCEMPNGSIVFVSTRRFGYTVCQPGPASNLHIMNSDGSGIRCVSMNTLSDMSPQLLPDGRVLFTRWEYIDRDLTFRQSLWTQNPDGSAYQLYFGNTIRDVGTFWQARPLPGDPDRVVATFAPHHGWPHGAIGIIDQRYGVEGKKEKSFTYITKEFPTIGDTSYEWSYRDPFPLDGDRFLCSYAADINRYRIVLLDRDNNKLLVYEDPQMSCFFPIPLEKTGKLPVIAERNGEAEGKQNEIENNAASMGTFVLVDVYEGLAPAVKRGEVKYLRIMEQLRKTSDLDSRAYDQSPVMSYGTYYAKRSWDTVPVLPDGSAYFTAPALKEIYFQVLDSEGRELQRMTSAIQLMPGEKRSCIGCHENRNTTSQVARFPEALLKPPAKLTPPAWGNGGIIDYPQLVQPVLDKYCIECHSADNPGGGYILTGDKTRYFSMSYDNLLGRSRSYRQHDMAKGSMLPEEREKGKPLVHFFWLLKTPTAVNKPFWTGSFASRLTSLIESDHAGMPLPLEDRLRIYTWIDANVPYYSTYKNARPRSPGKRDLWTDPQTGRFARWFTEGFMEVYNRRCNQCHGAYDRSTIDWEGRFAWINLSEAQASPALKAHRAKKAGGYGIKVKQGDSEDVLFSSTADADYQKMRRAIERGKKLAYEHPEPDMAEGIGR